MTKNLLPLLTFLVCACFLFSCEGKKTADADVDVKTDTVPTTPLEPVVTTMVDNFSLVTYYNTSGNLDSITVRNDSLIFVAVPMEAMARSRGMSDTLAGCLSKCKKSDGSFDLDCILRCPSKYRMQVTSRF